MERDEAKKQKTYEESYIEGRLQSVLGRMISEIDTTDEVKRRLRLIAQNNKINK